MAQEFFFLDRQFYFYRQTGMERCPAETFAYGEKNTHKLLKRTLFSKLLIITTWLDILLKFFNRIYHTCQRHIKAITILTEATYLQGLRESKKTGCLLHCLHQILTTY